ncbi:MAG: flagellar protein FliS [Ignavibacteriae bacterium HGW-Ignavibacteriae-3]|nr:MAG: flagellar protein FliS [Ignavibacteriae bacterium HGW-Ignavibacteriae-3]
MYTYTSLAHQSKPNPYLVNEINNATQEQLLLKVYDFIILHCQKKNMIKVNEAIQILMNGLSYNDPEVKEVSIGFLKLYQYCQDQARKNNFAEVQKIMTELRDTWKTAFNNR